MEEKMKIIDIGGPNRMPRIQKLYAFISEAEDGKEGICAVKTNTGSWMPLVFSDQQNFHQAEQIAKSFLSTEKKIWCAAFSKRQDMKEIIK